MLEKKTRRQRRRNLNKKNFPSEAWFEKLLKSKGIKNYQRNWCLMKTFFGDFVFCPLKLVVEIDGSSHNGKEDYDAWKDAKIKSRTGYDVIRINQNDSEKAFLVIDEIRDRQRKVKLKKNKKKRTVKKTRQRKRNKNFQYISKAFFRDAAEQGLAKKWLEENKP